MADKQAISKAINIPVFALIFVIAMCVNGILGLSGFEDVYRDALVSRYSISGEHIKSRVESSLNIGKKIYLLNDVVDSLFAETVMDSSGIEQLYIADKTGKILYSTRNVMNKNMIPFDCAPADSEQKSFTVRFLDSWFICMPLYTHETEFTGTLLIEFSQRAVASFITEYIKQIIKFAISLFIVVFTVYCIFVALYMKTARSERIFSTLLLLCSQLVFSAQNYRQYNNALTDIFNTNMAKLATAVSSAIKDTVAYLPLDEMSGVEEYLQNRIAGNIQCSGIFITDHEMTVCYQAVSSESELRNSIDPSSPDMTVMELENGGKPFNLALCINRHLIRQILFDMALDSATVIIVALIFAIILKNFFAFQIRKRDVLTPPATMNDMQEITALRLIQISTFVFMFAAYETLSFIPLYIQDVLNRSGVIPFGLSATTAESLPISTYMFGIMVAMFVTLFGLRHVSVRRRYLLMGIVFILGSVLTVMSQNITIFAIARLICGFGFGGILLSTSSLVIEFTSNRTRGAGFGTNAAAFAAASIASIPVGGVIVNKFGYAAGILVSVVFAAIFLLFAFFSLPEKTYSAEESNEKRSVSAKDFVRIFFSRHVLTYILFVNIPFQIIYWGLFQFLLPIYMSSTLSLSQGNIGRILGIFSVVSLAAASVSRLADKVKNDKLLIAVGGLSAGAALVLFGMMNGGFLLFLVLMVAMGIDNLFIDSIEELYLESGSVKGISEENLLQSYKVIEKVLSVFVPAVTSVIIATSGFNMSMCVIGAYSLAGAVLFVLFGRNGRWEKKNEN